MRSAPLIWLLLFLALAGCATLNRDECLYADWQAIGMEDGARGRDLSYLARHRKACAKHGVSPDTDRYRIGYASGLEQFCTPERGFSLGLQGSGYRGICPDDLEGDFLPAYQQGYAIFQTERQIKKITATINDQENYLADIQAEIKETRAHIISDRTPEKERSRLLKNLESLKREQEKTRRDSHHLQHSRQQLIDRLNLLKDQAGL